MITIDNAGRGSTTHPLTAFYLRLNRVDLEAYLAEQQIGQSELSKADFVVLTQNEFSALQQDAAKLSAEVDTLTNHLQHYAR